MKRAAVAVVLAGLLAASASGCQDDSPPPTRYAAFDKAICDAPALSTQFEKAMGHPLKWLTAHAYRFHNGDVSVNCHAKMPMTDTDRVSKQPPQLGVYDIEVDVDSDGTAYITSTWDNEEFFTNYDGPPKTENQHALHDGWWADGKIRTATWNAPYTHAGDPPRSLMLTAAMVKDGNLLVAVTLQYVSVPTSQIATYTKKNEDLAYAMINGLKPEFHTE